MSGSETLHKSTRIQQAMIDHGLPEKFFTTVQQFYHPLAQHIYRDLLEQSLAPSVKFIGIQGSQGSGKSTCAAFLKLLLEQEFGLRVLAVSIDDFYLTARQRKALAGSVHPLLLTRGVPGTHDVAMIHAMFDHAQQQVSFAVPSFDKSQDDRAAEDQWQYIDAAVDVIILEGWCVGLTAQQDAQLEIPINDLEAQEDPNRQWRHFVNQALQHEYHALFSRLDSLVTLQAPSFECVFAWRSLQEEKMIARLTEQGLDISKAQTPNQLEHFIAHYQRLTEHALQTMPKQADYLLRLDHQHQFIEFERLLKWGR